MLIYKATNTTNNKAYIGKTVQTLQKRIKGHCSYKGKSEFSRSLRKNPSNFVWEILEDNILEDCLDQREIFWISKFDTYLNGYNLTPGGTGGNNSKHIDYKNRKFVLTEEGREKKRNIMLTNNPMNNKNNREKISISKKGIKFTKEHVQKIQEAKQKNGTTWRGEKNPNFVLVTKEQKIFIKENLTMKRSELVKHTGLSYFMIAKVIRNFCK